MDTGFPIKSGGELDVMAIAAYLEHTDPTVLVRDISSRHVDPTDRLVVADVARELKKYEAALLCYQQGIRAIHRNPALLSADTTLSGAYYFLGKLLLLARRGEEAIDPLTRAALMQPSDATCWNLVGIANAVSGHLNVALDCFRKCVALEGTQANLDAEFFAEVRERIALTERELEKA